MKILYLVHNAGDPAVIRRVQTFLAGGADITVVGFQRSNGPVSFGGAKFISLGFCFDGRLIHRLGAIMRALAFSYRFRSELAAADVIVARNLDMLLIAATAKRLFRARASLVYECLDVHRMMLADSAAGRALRAVERKLLKSCDLLLVSSPAFVENYFVPVQNSSTPFLLVENKVMRLDDSPAVTPRTSGRPSGPPWRIGWFGVIRCVKSLEFLLGLVARYPGLVEVVIRGRPFLPLFDDFHGAIARQPGVEFLGPYSADDLGDMYTDVHFTWAVDFYEEGQNSTWLLPNRLYEGALFGAVPIAFSGVETGKWLARHDAGLLIDDLEDVAAALPVLTPGRYDEMVEAVASIPRSELVLDGSECVKLVESLRRSTSARSRSRAPEASGREANVP